MSTDEIKKALEEEKTVMGNDEVIKGIKKGTISKIFVASNYPEMEEIKYLCENFKVDIEELKETNEELGALCKVPFLISVLGIKKE